MPQTANPAAVYTNMHGNIVVRQLGIGGQENLVVVTREDAATLAHALLELVATAPATGG